MAKKEKQTHEMVWLKPKPPADKITAMVNEYFENEAAHYDEFDRSSEKRTKYIQAVNQCIADDLKSRTPASLLSVGCGTGKREIQIRELTGSSFSITGVEPSLGMATQAQSRGLTVINANWLEANLSGRFEAAMFPYWFGLVPNLEQRKECLRKLRKFLLPGSLFFLDVFNIEDETEWGPKIQEAYTKENLSNYGYELGDLFYRRKGSDVIGFQHYFSEEEIVSLLKEEGFQIKRTRYLSYEAKPGKLVTSKTEGIILITAILE